MPKPPIPWLAELLNKGADQAKRLPHRDEILAAYMRPLEFAPIEYQEMYFDRLGRSNDLRAKYINKERLIASEAAYDKLDAKGREQVLAEFNKYKMQTPELMKVLDDRYGEGFHDLYVNAKLGMRRDKLFGTQPVLSEGHISGMRKYHNTPEFYKIKNEKLIEFIEKQAKRIREDEKLNIVEKEAALVELQDQYQFLKEAKEKNILNTRLNHPKLVQEYRRGSKGVNYDFDAIKLAANDPDYNPFRMTLNDAERDLRLHTILGLEADPDSVTAVNRVTGEPFDEAVDSIDDLTYHPVNPQIGALYRYPESSSNPWQSSVGSKIQEFIANHPEPLANRHRLKALETFLLDIRDPKKQDILTNVADNMVYANLMNNLGTSIRSLFDPLKMNVSNADMVLAGKKLATTDELMRSIINTNSPMLKKITEFGEHVPKSILPDFTTGIESRQKALAYTAIMFKQARENGIPEHEVVSFLKGVTPDEADSPLFKMRAKALRELNETSSKLAPQLQRPFMKNGAFSLLRLGETGLKDFERSWGSLVDYLRTGDETARDIVKANARTAAAKTAVFGLPGLVSMPLIEKFQDSLPEEERKKSIALTNTLSKLGLVSSVGAAIGMDTKSLVQPAIQPLPLEFYSFPILDDIKALTGESDALSKGGGVKATVSSGVRLGGLLGRYIAPNNPVTQVVGALNPSATGRGVLETMRYLGISPDSEAPRVYKSGGLDNEMPLIPIIPALTAILGTSPDYARSRSEKNGTTF